MAIRWLADGGSIRNYVLPGPLSYSRMERHRPRQDDDSEPWIYSREAGRVRRTPLADAAPRRPRPGGDMRAYDRVEELAQRLIDQGKMDPEAEFGERWESVLHSFPDSWELVNSALGVPTRARERAAAQDAVAEFTRLVEEAQAARPDLGYEGAIEHASRERPDLARAYWKS